MDFIKQPMAIENRSMEIIAPHLAGLDLDERAVKVYSRMIHAAGDVDYAPIIRVSPDAIEAGMTALNIPSSSPSYTKGQRINPLVAPTIFIMAISSRRSKVVSLMVLETR